MAWEWVAPTATAVVALGGIAATWLTARGGRQTQMNLQSAQHLETRRLVEHDNRRSAYIRFAGEARELYRLVLLQNVLNELADGKRAEIKDSVYESLGLSAADIQWQLLLQEFPESASFVSDVEQTALHFQQLLPQDQALVRLTAISRLAEETRLIASRDVRKAVSAVEEACIAPLVMLLTHTAATPDQMSAFRTALETLQTRMSAELALDAGVRGGALTETFSRATGPVPKPQTASDQAKH
jgi:hypothetical protein